MPNIYEYEGDSYEDIYLTSGMLISHGFTRIVHGDRGAYVEFDPEQILHENLFVPDDKKWKLRHEMVYFVEHRTNDGTFSLVYEQRREVDYADYVPGMFYISPTKLKGFVVTDKY